MKPHDLLLRIDDEKAKVAHEALSSPAGRDAFDFGRAVGVYEGLARAHALVEEMLNERDRIQRDL